MNTLKDCPVELLQDEWEFEQLLSIYINKQPKNILEIGSFYGGTLWYWLTKSKVDKALTIDWPVPTSDGRYQQMIESKNKWKDWIDGITFNYIKGDSTHSKTIDEAKLFFGNEPIVDFLFIDGGHDYKTVKSDYENYSSLVKQGGIIVLHDVIGLGEVKQFWDELKSSGKAYIEICNNSQIGWGIGIIYV